MKKVFLPVGMLLVLMVFSTLVQGQSRKLRKELEERIEELSDEFILIPEDRKLVLEELGTYIYESAVNEEPAKLVVICTHNSRRSHIGQLWLHAAAAWYGVGEVQVFSGGTEATAFNTRAVQALKRSGFAFQKMTGGDNPSYSASILRDGAKDSGMLMFSKKFGHSQNPQEGFAALMVCSDADKSCPIVPGADARYSLPFDDPRYFDGTPSESKQYDETVQLIGREMLYAVAHAKQKLILAREEQK
jgi:protein-tyrosine-phosphatase